MTALLSLKRPASNDSDVLDMETGTHVCHCEHYCFTVLEHLVDHPSNAPCLTATAVRNASHGQKRSLVLGF
jgi:hypothetical protein